MKKYVKSVSSVDLDESTISGVLRGYEGSYMSPETGWVGRMEVDFDDSDGNYCWNLRFTGRDGDSSSSTDVLYYYPYRDGVGSTSAKLVLMPESGAPRFGRTVKDLHNMLRAEYSYLRQVDASTSVESGKRITASFDEMSYQEFRHTYSDALKKWPDLAEGYGRNYQIQLTTENYQKSGSRWELVESSTETVPFEWYMNAIDASPFFKNLGGKEKISKSYTVMGLVPVEIVSTSPDGTERTIRRYKISK